MDNKKRIILNSAEFEALYGLPLMAKCLYVFAIKPRMDYSSGLVGLKPKISWQALREWLHVEEHPGVKGGSPSKGQLRRAVTWLEKAGLIAVHSREKQLIFKCLLVTQDRSVQNKADTNPAQEADRLEFSERAVKSTGSEKLKYESRQVKNQKADIHSNNLTKLNYTTHLPSTYKEETVPKKSEEWVGYFVDVLNFSLAKVATCKNVVMYDRWCALNLSIKFINQAISIAEAQLGQRPDTPTYYRGFVESLLQNKEIMQAQITNQKKVQDNKQEYRDVRRPKRKSAALIMWESCREGLEGSDFDPDVRTRH